MKTRTRFNRSGRVERGAFTLVELMVVITIIAALVALSASAVLKFIQVQQTSNTQSTLDRVQSQIAKAWSKVKDQAFKEPIPLPVVTWMTASYGPVSFAGTDANATQRMRYLYVKLKLRQAFPMSFSEALTPPMLPPPAGVCTALAPLPAYQTYLGSLGIAGSSPATAPYESSACLLMALQRGVGGAGINPAELTAGGAAGSLQLAGGSLPYLTDAWNRPIFFTRAPAGNLYLNPNTPNSFKNIYTITWPVVPVGGLTNQVICYSQPGANDPGDPQGYLMSPSWRSIGGGSFFFYETLEVMPGMPTATPPILTQNANTSFKLAPMIASGGPTNWTKTGIIPPFDPITFYTVPGSGALFSAPQ